MKEISKTMDILVLLERIWITLNFPAQAQELETLKKKKMPYASGSLSCVNTMSAGSAKDCCISSAVILVGRFKLWNWLQVFSMC